MLIVDFPAYLLELMGKYFSSESIKSLTKYGCIQAWCSVADEVLLKPLTSLSISF